MSFLFVAIFRVYTQAKKSKKMKKIKIFYFFPVFCGSGQAFFLNFFHIFCIYIRFFYAVAHLYATSIPPHPQSKQKKTHLRFFVILSTRRVLLPRRSPAPAGRWGSFVVGCADTLTALCTLHSENCFCVSATRKKCNHGCCDYNRRMPIQNAKKNYLIFSKKQILPPIQSRQTRQNPARAPEQRPNTPT